MKKYEVKVWQTTREHGLVTVEAESEDDAKEKAYYEATSSMMEWTHDDADVQMQILREVSNGHMES